LYEGAHGVDLSRFLNDRTTLAVAATVHNNPEIRHSGFAALKVKDAVVDALRNRMAGRRPDVNVEDPDVPLALHIREREARLYVDLAGAPLHRRGYRVAMGDAPLKESLAAAVLALGGASRDLSFIDPMAGTGTLAIEHAQICRRMAPGLKRSFAFERWADQSHMPVFRQLKQAAQDLMIAHAPCPIVARDSSQKMVAAARRNAQAAGVADDIRFETAEISSLTPEGPSGILCMNPPYGERLQGSGSGASPQKTFTDIARALDRMGGWTAIVLCGNPMLAHLIRHKHRISHRLWNGPLETRLLVYSL